MPQIPRPPAPSDRTGPLLVLLSLLLGLSLVAPPDLSAQEARPKARVTVDDALGLRGVGDVAVSPDGRWVAYVVSEREVRPEEGIHRVDRNLWVAEVATGETTQLTHDPASDGSPRWAPDGSWIAFLSDRTETPQVHGIRPDGGGPWRVTDSETAVGSFRIAPGGERIAYTASPTPDSATETREARLGRPMVADSAYGDQYTLLWIADLVPGRAGDSARAGRAEPGPAEGEPAPPLRAAGAAPSSPDTLHVGSFAWGPDGRALAWSARPRPELSTYREAAVWVQDSAGADPRLVSDLPGGDGVAAWPREPGLLVTGSGHALGAFNDEVWLADPSGEREPRSLTEALDHDAGFVAASGDRLLVESPVRTGHGAFRIPLDGGEPAGEPRRLDDGELYASGFSASADGSRLAFVAEGPRTPPDVHASPASDFSPRRLTAVNPGAADFRLGEQRVVSWESSAGDEEIEGVLTLPVGWEEGETVPLLVDVHGGPPGVDGMDYKAGGYAYPTQVFAGLGYAVLQPNYRGSSGYGQSFLHAGDHEWGTGAMQHDITDGVQHLIDRGIADPERVGIFGGSYGGYATLAGVAFTPDLFAAGVPYVAPSNLITLIESFPAYWRPFLEGTWYQRVGDPEEPEDRERLKR